MYLTIVEGLFEKDNTCLVNQSNFNNDYGEGIMFLKLAYSKLNYNQNIPCNQNSLTLNSYRFFSSEIAQITHG